MTMHAHAQYPTPESPASREPGHAGKLLAEHDDQIGSIDAALGELEMRLTPVLRPLEPCNEGEMLKEIREAASPLVDDLRAKASRLDGLHGRIVGLLRRLEI